MVGQERTVLPLLAGKVFGVAALSAALTFIVAFGLTKATNFAAGTLSDRFGRKPVLVAGWLIGLPVPLLLIWAPVWDWVVLANVLLGVKRGLTWSITVIMKIDLVGPARRGLAMGLNEAAGYGTVALTAFASAVYGQTRVTELDSHAARAGRTSSDGGRPPTARHDAIGRALIGRCTGVDRGPRTSVVKTR